jgi:FRG domain-containing protein
LVYELCTMAKNYLVTKVANTWDEYLKFVGSEYKHWAFRGQQDALWQLWPTITRELKNRRIDNQHWNEQEHRIIWIFQRKSIHFLEKVPHISDVFQWMALLQHHGAPTRLLDFTWSPYVAAFFALDSSVDDAAVWLINAKKIGTHCFRSDLWNDDWVPSPQEALKRYRINKRTDIAIGEPFVKNQRLIAQSGTFVCPYDINYPVDEILSSRKDLIAKIILKKSLRKSGIAQLHSMNITQASLFPGLDGMARSLKTELELHYKYDPTIEKI